MSETESNKLSENKNDTEPNKLSKSKTDNAHNQTLSEQQTNPTDKIQSRHSPAEPPVIIKPSSGRAAAVVALVLSLSALALTGLLFIHGQNQLKVQELTFNQKIDKAASGESNNTAVLQNILHKQRDNQAVLEQIIGNQKQNTDKINASLSAYQTLLKGRTDWLINETEATLHLASQQLLLGGNMPAVAGLLERIEARLNHFNIPELLPIKRAIRNDLDILKKHPYFDAVAAAQRLNRLADTIDTLPTVVENTAKRNQTNTQVSTTESHGNLSWQENAKQKTLAALKSLVEVRRLDSGNTMLITPEQAYFIRENLRLHLLTARLTLLQQDSSAYSDNLNRIRTAVKQYFDTGSSATQAWLGELDSLPTADKYALPDNLLINSFNAIRSYQKASSPMLPEHTTVDKETPEQESTMDLPRQPDKIPPTDRTVPPIPTNEAPA